MIIRGVKNNILGYTQVDKYVFTKRGLSDGAKVLHGYLAGLKDAENFSDTYILKALGISSTVLARRKKELKDHDLILVDQIGPRVYILYVGSTKISASAYKEQFTAEEDS